MFGKNKTIETRLAALLAHVRSALGLTEEQATAFSAGDETILPLVISGLTGARDTALADVASRDQTILSLTAERDQARADLATANTARETADQTSASLREIFRGSLNITDDQFASVTAGDNTIITSAITAIAKREAVNIAAGQGVPPVITAPGATGAGEDDEIKLAYEAAAAEPDPRKRAALFKRASELVNAKGKSASN